MSSAQPSTILARCTSAADIERARADDSNCERSSALNISGDIRQYRCFDYHAALRLRLNANAPTARPSNASEPGSGTAAEATVPFNEKEALKFGAGAPPMISVPIRSQSGSRLSLRIQLWRSAGAGMVFGADNQ